MYYVYTFFGNLCLSFGHVAKFKYLGKTLTDQNCMSEEMKQQVKLRERYRMFCVLVAVQEDERYRMFCFLVAVQEDEP